MSIATSTQDRQGDSRGRVIGLHYTPRAMLPIRNVPEINLIVGAGVEGDRYAVGKGFLSAKAVEFGVKDQREVTLFPQESVEMLRQEHGIHLAPGEHRRNITTSGVDLAALVGKRFRIGAVVLEGFDTTACKHLDEVVGKPIAVLLFRRWGINARIIEGGRIRLGDVVEAL